MLYRCRGPNKYSQAGKQFRMVSGLPVRSLTRPCSDEMTATTAIRAKTTNQIVVHNNKIQNTTLTKPTSCDASVQNYPNTTIIHSGHSSRNIEQNIHKNENPFQWFSSLLVTPFLTMTTTTTMNIANDTRWRFVGGYMGSERCVTTISSHILC